MEKTPCPSCGQAIAVRGQEADCGACGQHVRFVDVADRPCSSCGAALALTSRVVRCNTCGVLQAADARRTLRHVVRCPRCRRRLEVAATAADHACPHCGTQMSLRDTF